MRTRHFILKWVSVIAILIGIAFASYELFHWMTHVYEFDARIRSDLTRVSSKVNGTIDEILVKEGEEVKRGDLLVSMNGDVIKERINALQAELLGEHAKKDKLVAEKLYFNVELNARVRTKNEAIQALKVELAALLNRHALAKAKLKRTKFLVNKNLTSAKALDSDQDHVLDLSGQMNVSQAKLKVAELELQEIRAKRGKIAVLDQGIKISAIAAQRLGALIKEVEIELGERFIVSPTSGVIDKIYKNPGEYVEDADELLVLHDPKNIWIEANIEEGQIRHLKLGQLVKVDFNAYPFDSFKGEVVGIGMATIADLEISKSGLEGSRARRLTQRIPVKINLLDRPKITAPGMLVEVNIQIQDKVVIQ